MVAFTGAVLGAIAIILLFSADEPQERVGNILLLVASLLMIWASRFLSRENAHAWLAFHVSGILVTGAAGIALLFFSIPTIIEQLASGIPFSLNSTLCVFLGSILLIIWSLFMLTERQWAHRLWEFSLLPLGLLAVVLWATKVHAALGHGQSFAIALSAIWLVIGVVVPKVVSREKRQVVQVETPKSQPAQPAHPGKEDALDEVYIIERYPSIFHEKFAKGQFCEMLDLPCDPEKPCPLQIRVASQYQRLYLENQHSLPIQRVLDQAYTILITPRLRELCRIAHEVMRAKEKQLGPKKFARMQSRLWKTIWNRLQDDEIKGDPQKAHASVRKIIDET